jgi:hypothetical protein
MNSSLERVEGDNQAFLTAQHWPACSRERKVQRFGFTLGGEENVPPIRLFREFL